MPILNFNLSRQAQAIVQIICLYDPGSGIPNSPIGPFQYNVDSFGNFSIRTGHQLQRDTAVASAGFNASYDLLQGANSYPLPNNAFVINTPTNVYGAAANGDNSYSVIQVNSVLANVEPGFSRLRIDYVDTTGTVQPAEYFDCPFYEGWDVTARELNNIVRYIQGAVGFLQREIDGLRSELDYIRSHDFWRGTSVSGQIQWSPATTGLVSGVLSRSQFPHDMQPKSLSNPYPGLAVSADSLKAAIQNVGGKTSNGQEFYAYGTNSNSDGQWGPSVLTYYMCGNTDGTATFVFFDTILQNTARVNGGPYNFVINMTGGLDVTTTDPSNSWQGLTVYSGAGATGPNPGIGVQGGYTPHSGTYTYYVSPSASFTWPYVDVNTGSGSAGVVPPWGHGNTIGFNNPTQAGVVAVNDPHYGGNVWAFYTIIQPPAATKKIPQIGYASTAQNSFSSNDYYIFSLQKFGADIVLGGVTGPPTISSVSPSSCCPNTTVTLTGSNFDKSYNIYVGDLSHPTNAPTYINNTTATCVIPVGTPSGPTQLIMSNGSYQTSIPFNILPSPSVASVTDGTTGAIGTVTQGDPIILRGTNFGATQGTGGVGVTDYKDNTVFPTVTISQWSDTQITFTIPANTTPQRYLATVSQGCGADYGFFDLIAGNGATPVLSLTPVVSNLTNGQVQQFTAFLQIGTNPPQDVTASCTWFVNNTQGGDVTDGIITSKGLYNAPVTISSVVAESIKATYSYTNPLNPSDPLNGIYTAYATVNLSPNTQLTSPYATVTVVSQLNVFLGDGRAGYVPLGQTVNAYPGEYIYVQFAEEYDPITKIPVASNTDIQNLTMKTKNALDSDIGNVLYNLTGMTIDASTGRVSTKRTVVLGIIDPTDGLWHSMWDIGLPAQVAADTDSAHSLPTSSPKALAYYGEDLPAFTPGHPFTGSIVDYINDLAGAHQTQLTHLQKRSNTLVTGNCYYDATGKTLEVLDQLHVFGVTDENRYRVVATIPVQTIAVDLGHFVYIDGEELKVNRLGSEVPQHNVVVLGVAFDRFYSMWPIFPQYTIQLEE